MYDGPTTQFAVAPARAQAPVCVDCDVRDTALCGSLDDGALLSLNRLGRRQHVHAGETLSWAGDESRTCANILSGLFKLSALTSDGREQIVGLLYPADFVGQPYAERVEFSVTALSDAEVCLFPRGAFEDVVADNGPLERELLRRTLQSLGEARRRILLLGRQSATERVAGFLLEMAARLDGCRGRAGGPVTFDLPLSRGAIGDVLGLTIETVSRQMTKLRNSGVIALPGGRAVTIMQQGALQGLAGLH